jgi:predicted phosphodiesterase
MVTRSEAPGTGHEPAPMAVLRRDAYGLARALLRWALIVLAVLVPSVIWGVTTASAQASLGPHTARYEVVLDGDVTVDLGPLGMLIIDSPMPLGLGVHVFVQEIPRDVTSVEVSATLQGLQGDLKDYIELFSGPEATIEGAVRALVFDAIRRTVLAALAIVGSVLLARAVLGAPRRAELRSLARQHRMAITAAVSVLVLVAGTVTASERTVPTVLTERTASSVFDGTPLEGARITGRLAGVIDTYGGYVVDAYRANEAFYKAATAAVGPAWADRMAEDERVAIAQARFWPFQEEPVDADEPPEPVTMLVVSDLHCNIGMADVIREVAELSGASAILNAGDTTINGSAVESYCITAFDDAVPDGAAMVVVNGNHDGPDTETQAQQAGWQVLDGEVTEVEGIRILGDADPRATRIGSGTAFTGEESVSELGERLTDVACADEEGVDLLLVHDPAVGTSALARGCVSAQVSGHLHSRQNPSWVGQGSRYVSSSTAGASLANPTIGPLTSPAEMTVLRFDPETGQVTDYRLIRVLPDATVTVGVALAWPKEPPDRGPEALAR